MISRPDRQRLIKIVNYCVLILDKTLDSGLNYDTILLKISEDIIFQTSTSMMLVQIGELARHLSDGLKDQYAEISWKTISGLRNRLVHDYEETNWSIIAGVIEDDIRPLLDSCNAILCKESTCND